MASKPPDPFQFSVSDAGAAVLPSQEPLPSPAEAFLRSASDSAASESTPRRERASPDHLPGKTRSQPVLHRERSAATNRHKSRSRNRARSNTWRSRWKARQPGTVAKWRAGDASQRRSVPKRAGIQVAAIYRRRYEVRHFPTRSFRRSLANVRQEKLRLPGLQHLSACGVNSRKHINRNSLRQKTAFKAARFSYSIPGKIAHDAPACSCVEWETFIVPEPEVRPLFAGGYVSPPPS